MLKKVASRCSRRRDQACTLDFTAKPTRLTVTPLIDAPTGKDNPMNTPNKSSQTTARRDFLKQSGGVLAGAALASAIASRSYAGENNTIKVALVGCGGRGTGAAANALSTKGPVKLWAMADVFENRLQTSCKNLSKQFPKQVEVTKVL
jgi:hypothetical protein